MKIETRRAIFIILFIITLSLSLLILPKFDNFRDISKTGCIFLFLTIILSIIYNKRLLTPTNIILLSFILFQFGLPFLYAIDSTYTNWYIEQFSESSLVNNSIFSVICIESFAFGLMISKKNKQLTKKNIVFLSDDNSNLILVFSRILLLITGIVAMPLGVYVSYLGILHGYEYIKLDSMNIYNGLTRFAQEFFVAAVLLCIIFSKTKKSRNFYMIIALLYSIILVFSGARTTSIAIILVLIFIRNDNINKKKIKNNIIIIVGITLLAFFGSFVAQQRKNVAFNKENGFMEMTESVIEEMGFNFTTINFVESFVPSSNNYQYGMTYIKSFLCLIPKTLDPTSIIKNINKTLPEIELSNWLTAKYGNLYSFGVGYSVIAEAYYNFGLWGFISVFIQGLIIGKIMSNSDEKNKTKFQKYIEYILLFALLTYPRRSFLTLLKCIEYYIVFIILAIFLLYQRNRKIRGDEE